MADHIEVLDTALAQLPCLPADANVVVRADSGGSAQTFLAHVRGADVAFSVSMRLTEPIRAAIRTLTATPACRRQR